MRYVALLLALINAPAFAIVGVRGEQWKGPGFTLNFDYLPSANDIFDMGKTELDCGEGAKPVDGRAAFAGLQPLRDYAAETKWDLMSKFDTSLFHVAREVPENELYMLYNDPSYGPPRGYKFDLSGKPEAMATIQQSMKKLCAGESVDSKATK